MKILSVFLAALTVTSITAHAYVDSYKDINRFEGALGPRGGVLVPRTGDSVVKKPAGSKGKGPAKDGGSDGAGRNPDPVANREGKIEELKTDDRDPKNKPELSKPQKLGSIKKGRTGWMVDTSDAKHHRIIIKYGRRYSLADPSVGEEGRKAAFSMISDAGAEGTARDEKSFNFLRGEFEGDLDARKKYANYYDVNHEQATVVRVPGYESTDEGTMAKAIKEYMEEHPGSTAEFDDNRDPADPTTKEEAPPIKGPVVPDFDEPYWVTGYVAGARKSNRGGGGRKLLKARDGLDQISSDESTTASTSSPSNIQQQDLETQQSEFSTYFQLWDTLQANATNAIVPIIKDMVRYTNESAVWDAAWSVFCLVCPDVHIVGPFYAGAKNFASWEEQTVYDFANITNRTAANRTMDAVYAYHYLLIDIYDRAYAKATETLNRTGLADDMDAVGDAIAKASNSSLNPEDRMRISKAPIGESDDAFFLQPGRGNETMRVKGKREKRSHRWGPALSFF